MFVPSVAALLLVSAVSAHLDILGEYEDTKNKLGLAFFEANLADTELDQLAKDIVAQTDEKAVEDIVHEACDGKPKIVQDSANQYLSYRAMEKISDKVERIVSKYLNREQSAHLRLTLSRLSDVSNTKVVEIVKKELGKDVGEEQAEELVEKIRTELQDLHKNQESAFEAVEHFLIKLL